MSLSEHDAVRIQVAAVAAQQAELDETEFDLADLLVRLEDLAARTQLSEERVLRREEYLSQRESNLLEAIDRQRIALGAVRADVARLLDELAAADERLRLLAEPTRSLRLAA